MGRFVRVARRDMTRLLRGLQASGRSLAGWPDEVVTRLAHVDVVTARWLREDPAVTLEDTEDAARALRELERWILGRLSTQELAEVRTCELAIRITDAELTAPLLRLEALIDEAGIGDTASPGPGGPSLWQALRQLSDEGLDEVVSRLGLGRRVARRGEHRERSHAERAVVDLLADGHLLGILVATLPIEAQHLLGELARDTLDGDLREVLAVDPPAVTLVGGAGCERVPWRSPAQTLRGCGLAFVSDGALWVPPELRRRLDGVLRMLGV